MAEGKGPGADPRSTPGNEPYPAPGGVGTGTPGDPAAPASAQGPAATAAAPQRPVAPAASSVPRTTAAPATPPKPAAPAAPAAPAPKPPTPPAAPPQRPAASASAAAPQPKAFPLRQDGPTKEEYVAAGFSADTYPPPGYAARESSQGNGIPGRQGPKLPPPPIVSSGGVNAPEAFVPVQNRDMRPTAAGIRGPKMPRVQVLSTLPPPKPPIHPPAQNPADPRPGDPQPGHSGGVPTAPFLAGEEGTTVGEPNTKETE